MNSLIVTSALAKAASAAALSPACQEKMLIIMFALAVGAFGLAL